VWLKFLTALSIEMQIIWFIALGLVLGYGFSILWLNYRRAMGRRRYSASGWTVFIAFGIVVLGATIAIKKSSVITNNFMLGILAFVTGAIALSVFNYWNKDKT
jgi:hypothetical protein